jgi:hypothetical protein
LEHIGLRDNKRAVTGIVIKDGHIEFRQYYFQGGNNSEAYYRKRVVTYSVDGSDYSFKNTYNTCRPIKDETIKITSVDSDRILLDMPGSGEFTMWRVDNLDKFLSDNSMVACIEDITCSGIGVQGEFAKQANFENGDVAIVTLVLDEGHIESRKYLFPGGDPTSGRFVKKVGTYKVNSNSYGAEEGETFEIAFEFDTCGGAKNETLKIAENFGNIRVKEPGFESYELDRQSSLDEIMKGNGVVAVEDSSLCD